MTASEQRQVIRSYLRDLARLAVDELLEETQGQNKGADEGLENLAGAKGENDGQRTRSQPRSTS